MPAREPQLFEFVLERIPVAPVGGAFRSLLCLQARLDRGKIAADRGLDGTPVTTDGSVGILPGDGPQKFRRTEFQEPEVGLLDQTPALQMRLEHRNPWIDPLSHLQVELLRRLRAGRDEARGPLLATITGIAFGMRNTG